MPGQGRLGDKANVPLDAHGCPACPHPAIGPAIQGSPDVNVNKRPALRVDDPGIHAACCGANTWSATKGSMTVFINGKGAHRMGDQNRHCGGMGTLVEGSPNVIVGETGGGGGGGGSSASSSASGGGGGSSTGGGGGSAGGGSSPAPAPANAPPPVAPVDATKWVEVQISDADGVPLAREAYELKTPDGVTHTGKTDASGVIRVDAVPEGVCEIRFPKLNENSRKVPR